MELEVPDAATSSAPGPTDSVIYDAPPPVERDLGPFRVKLADGVLTVTMAEHHADEASARASVEPYLTAWEIHAALCRGRGELAFRFEKAEVVDRNPPAAGSPQTVLAAMAGHIRVSGKLAALQVTRRTYPEPPGGFVASPDVETLYQRYEGYLNGREPIGSMAYFCLTVLEGLAGGRAGDATTFGISLAVLDRLGRLATEIGDDRTRRKFGPPSTPPPKRAVAWLDAAVKAIILRVGEWAHNSDAPRPQLTMGDLPSLD